MDLWASETRMRLELGKLNSLLRQWNGSEDIVITNFFKILWRFAIVFLKKFWIFSFLSLTIITGQRNFLSLADGLHDRTHETTNGFELFSLQNVETFLLNFALRFFDMV